MTKKLLLLFLFILPFLTKAQTFSYRHFSVEDGLPTSEVYDAVQDNQGFMWFGTDRGVVRFDGYEFEVFTTDDGLPDNVVFHLFKDHIGRIWFVSFSSQLSYYQEGEIYQYKYNGLIREELGVPLILSFSVDSLDGVNLGVRSRGYWYINAKGEMTGQELEAGRYQIKETGEKLIYYMNGAHRAHVPSGYYSELTHTSKEDIITKHTIPGFNENTDYGLIEAACYFGDTVLFSIRNKLYTLYNQSLECIYTAPASIAVMLIVNNKVWLGMSNNGFLMLDLTHLDNPGFNHLKKENISAFFEDREGAIWITTLNNGVYYLSNYEHMSFSEESNGEIKDVYKMASSGEHLLISDSKGILTWLDLKNDSSFFFTDYAKTLSKPPRIKYFKQFDSFFFHDDIYLSRVHPNREKKTYRYHGHFEASNDTIYRLTYFPIYPNFDKDEIHFVELGIGQEMRNTGARVLYFSEKHKIIGGIGGIQELILLPNGEMDSVLYWKYKDPIFETRVVDIVSYDGYDFIAATRGEGILFVKDGVVTTLKKQDGLLSNQITCVFVDSNQTIWAGSSDGISIIDREAGITNLRVEDGLISNEVTAIYANEEKAYIGTRKGLTILKIEHVFKTQNDIPVVFKSIDIENQELQIDGEMEIEIAHDEPFLAVEFAGISYKSGGQINYKYRLNKNEGWQYTKINRLLLSNLASGEYNLEVFASSDGENWGGRPAEIKIIVTPPVWQTLRFKTIIFIAFSLLLILIYKLAVRRVARREKIERQIQNLRFEALSAQMNPHFIFNSLNSIQNFIIKNEKKSSVQYLSKFAKLMRKTLDHSQRKNITLSNELEALYLYLDLEILRFGNSIHYDVEVDKAIQVEKVILPALLIQPIVENAILHGLRPKVGLGLIRLAFLKEGKDLIIQIEDNGVGRSLERENKTTGHQSQGSALTKERIALFSESFEGQHEYYIIDLMESGKNAGTRVNIKIPYILNNHPIS